MSSKPTWNALFLIDSSASLGKDLTLQLIAICIAKLQILNALKSKHDETFTNSYFSNKLLVKRSDIMEDGNIKNV